MKPDRFSIAAEIERLIDMLDQLDDDPDLELEPLEEQYDTEADLTWTNGYAPDWFVIAERSRRKAKSIQ
ncbi:hypothetical protein [Brucella anthropi]|uniref:Uncharacterized protein n=1 Tax=Brucella anthropi TaxID=529 RepID=A0A6L3YZZ1_BRUAN|nr:hypothetical protein [Brucella anthropi]KAB2763060.1 hypothetical protein F9L04_21725 [Brucella anthropi]UVV67037.1 hypothetical protein NW321_11230 [Brucella anthropi]